MVIKNSISNKKLVEKYFANKKILNKADVQTAGLYTNHEFRLTRRRGKVVTIEEERYTWSTKARLKQQNYHLTKNGISFPKPILQKIDRKNKEKLLAERPFSYFHNKLIENLYGKRSWKEKNLKAQAEKAKHEIALENTAKRLKDYKSSLKLKNPKNMLYKISSYYSDGKQHIKLLSENYVPKEPSYKEIAELNKGLSVYPFYRHTVVRKIGERTDRFLFVSTNLAI